MIASLRCVVVASWLAACGGATVGSPVSVAVLVQPESAGAALRSALHGRGVEASRVSVARAGTDVAAEARRELARAVEAQQSFREAEALESLSRAETLAVAQGVGAAERAILAEVGFLRTWLHLNAGRTAEAESEASRTAVFADPGTPDPARYPPEVVALFARIASTPRPTGALRIELQGGDGAAVRVDGRDLGGAPLEAGGLAAGAHTVAVVAPGRRTIADRVEVPAGATVARTYTLAPLEAPELARAALHRTGERRVDVARELAASLSVDGVVVATASRRGGSALLEGHWIPVTGAVRSIEGRGSTMADAAEAVARSLGGAGRRENTWGISPTLWILGGAVVAAGAVGVIYLATDGRSSSDAGVRCCALR